MLTQDEPLWFLTDNIRPVPFRTGGEEIPIRSAEQLIEALRAFAASEPRVLILAKHEGPQLFIGLHGELAAVNVYPQPTTGKSWFGKAKTLYSSDDLWITSEGEPTLFKSWSAMPTEDVIQILAYIVKHDELPETVEWMNYRSEYIHSLRERF